MRRHTNEWWVRILRTKKMGYVGIRIATINGDRNTCKHFIWALLLIYFAMWKVIVERLSIIVTNLVETIGDGDQDLSSDVMNCDERRGPWCLPQRWGLYTDRLCFTSITNTKCTHAHTHTKGTHAHTHIRAITEMTFVHRSCGFYMATSITHMPHPRVCFSSLLGTKNIW